MVHTPAHEPVRIATVRFPPKMFSRFRRAFLGGVKLSQNQAIVDACELYTTHAETDQRLRVLTEELDAGRISPESFVKEAIAVLRR